MQLIDAHCHLDFEVFDADRVAVLQRAANAGVTHIIVPGVRAAHWQRIHALATQPQIHACYGLHPYVVAEHHDSDLAALETFMQQHHCVALGECGLDYRDGQPERALQLHFFRSQLDIAARLDKPVVIHAVRAVDDVICELKKFPALRGMVHSYSGSLEQARTLAAMGFYISLGGSVTHARAQRLHNVARQICLTQLLIETDAPDQSDALHTGQRNEPAYLENVMEFIAKLRNQPQQQIAAHTTANARRLFDL